MRPGPLLLPLSLKPPPASSLVAAAAAAAAVEHGQLAAEFLQHDFGGVFLGAGLVGPFAGLQRALDIDLAALLQEPLADIHQAVVEHHHAVPLRALAPLAAALVAPAFRGRQRQVGDPRPVLGRADLRIAAQIADQNDLVDAASHSFPACLSI